MDSYENALGMSPKTAHELGPEVSLNSPRYSIEELSLRQTPWISTPDHGSASDNFNGTSDPYPTARSLGSQEDTSPSPPFLDDMSPHESRAELLRQLAYHRVRRDAIHKSVEQFEEKMKELMDWHKEQESFILLQLQGDEGHSSNGRGSGLRRGRSKLSERLYSAIDQSMT
jgi:hypothetical protein